MTDESKDSDTAATEVSTSISAAYSSLDAPAPVSDVIPLSPGLNHADDWGESIIQTVPIRKLRNVNRRVAVCKGVDLQHPKVYAAFGDSENSIAGVNFFNLPGFSPYAFISNYAQTESHYEFSLTFPDLDTNGWFSLMGENVQVAHRELGMGKIRAVISGESFFDKRTGVGMRFARNGPVQYILQIHKSKANYTINDFMGVKTYAGDSSTVSRALLQQGMPSPNLPVKTGSFTADYVFNFPDDLNLSTLRGNYKLVVFQFMTLQPYTLSGSAAEADYVAAYGTPLTWVNAIAASNEINFGTEGSTSENSGGGGVGTSGGSTGSDGAPGGSGGAPEGSGGAPEGSGGAPGGSGGETKSGGGYPVGFTPYDNRPRHHELTEEENFRDQVEVFAYILTEKILFNGANLGSVIHELTRNDLPQEEIIAALVQQTRRYVLESKNIANLNREGLHLWYQHYYAVPETAYPQSKRVRDGTYIGGMNTTMLLAKLQIVLQERGQLLELFKTTENENISALFFMVYLTEAVKRTALDGVLFRFPILLYLKQADNFYFPHDEPIPGETSDVIDGMAAAKSALENLAREAIDLLQSSGFTAWATAHESNLREISGSEGGPSSGPTNNAPGGGPAAGPVSGPAAPGPGGSPARVPAVGPGGGPAVVPGGGPAAGPGGGSGGGSGPGIPVSRVPFFADPDPNLLPFGAVPTFGVGKAQGVSSVLATALINKGSRNTLNVNQLANSLYDSIQLNPRVFLDTLELDRRIKGQVKADNQKVLSEALESQSGEDAFALMRMSNELVRKYGREIGVVTLRYNLSHPTPLLKEQYTYLLKKTNEWLKLVSGQQSASIEEVSALHDNYTKSQSIIDEVSTINSIVRNAQGAEFNQAKAENSRLTGVLLQQAAQYSLGGNRDLGLAYASALPPVPFFQVGRFADTKKRKSEDFELDEIYIAETRGPAMLDVRLNINKFPKRDPLPFYEVSDYNPTSNFMDVRL